MPLQANWFHVLNPSGGLRATPVALTPVAMLTASSTAARTAINLAIDGAKSIRALDPFGL
jgi:hypothetical protein